MTFNGTPFNNDQLEHMRDLAKRDPATLCWCGWYEVGKCYSRVYTECAEGKSAADKMAVWCPSCRNPPRDGVITHVRGCAKAEQPESATNGDE